MSINRDEALRAQDLAEGLMKSSDFTAARKLATKAQKMDSSLENICRMIMVCEVHCAATEKSFGNEKDWYGILQVAQNADDIIIKKQYKRLALLLHPDKNKLPGAESAFKLIGEAQRILLDKEKRMLHDGKRKTWRKPAPARSYKTQQVPTYHTNPVFQATVNMRNVFNGLRPENRPPQQKAQAQPAGFSHRPTFWTSCPFCQTKYQYLKEHVKICVTCQTCKKQFTAFETAYQSVPVAKSSCQTSFSFPQQNKFPGQKACSEPQKHPDHPAATVPSGKTSFSVPGSTAENNNGKRKRKRKNLVESSESSDSDSSSSESEDVLNDDTVAARSNGGHERRKSVRSKRQVSYNENVSDDDADLVNENGEGSRKNMDTEMEEEPEEEKQTHENHQSTETLPNGVNPKEKIIEDQAENSDGVSDSESAAKPNLFNYDDPDFNDFDKFREKSCFEVGQIWASYDEEEGMPRFYALIKKVTSPNFLIKYVWLEAEEDQDHETRDLPVGVGKFELGDQQETDESSIFSHLMYSKTRSRARHFKVFPRKGETWALYKNWNNEELSDSPREYEFVEILSDDHAEGAAVTVGFLSKVEGFSCVFCPMPEDESDTLEITPHDLCRFSHRIPHFRLTGTEGRGVKAGWYELDPASLPGSRNLSGEESAQDQDQQSPPSGSAS